ncbi:MAG: helix-turn-helix transcriptional regulator [Firmicutes bacterium]|nr:helix-turn-helix transcriptional regulator [Bacillota bacterium]
MNNKIAVLRKERGLTQQALAEKLSVSRQTVISLESGRYNPSIRLAYDIAQVFGCIIEEVFLFEEDEV